MWQLKPNIAIRIRFQHLAGGHYGSAVSQDWITMADLEMPMASRVRQNGMAPLYDWDADNRTVSRSSTAYVGLLMVY